MGKSVSQLLDEMSSKELAEWMAYDQLEPIGDLRGDIQAALIAYTIASVWSKEPPELESFLLFHEKQAQTFDEMRSIIRRVPPKREIGK